MGDGTVWLALIGHPTGFKPAKAGIQYSEALNFQAPTARSTGSSAFADVTAKPDEMALTGVRFI
jgi:hypothetical protein